MQPGQSSIGPPAWFEHTPVELRFGTSGLRGLVRDMTDLEICVATSGFLAYLKSRAELDPGEALAIAEDLRLTDPTTGLESSPRIARAVARAARDAGLRPVHCGRIPTPALAHWAMRRDPGAGKEPMACVMVTGSHIPADRNGVKFYRKSGEILKADEAGIIAAVGAARTAAYAQGEQESPFDARGMLKRRFEPEPAHPGAERAYVARYAGAFGDARPLAGRRIVVYQHGAVGRDLLVQIFAALGADVVAVGRSEEFVPVDTEDISPAQEARYAALVAEHRADALVSTDGDGDRPLVVDETGRFRRGDVLGTVAAEYLGAGYAAVPISTTDALDLRVAERARTAGAVPMRIERTRIGSPYVIAAMAAAVDRGMSAVVGWEANGGFLTASELPLGGARLAPLPTRDAVLPLCAALLATAERGVTLSQLFGELPPRATRAGLIDRFPPEASRAILAALSPADPEMLELELRPGAVVASRAGGVPALVLDDADPRAAGARALAAALGRYFTAADGFGPVARINFLDGVRVLFAGGDIAHLRPSGNAPQMRCFAVSDTQQRADEIVALAIREPDGLLRRMEREVRARAGAGVRTEVGP